MENKFFMAVFGVVIFSSKNLTGKLLAPYFNEFAELGMNFEKAVSAKDVAILWQTICEVLYVASLKLAQMTGAN